MRRFTGTMAIQTMLIEDGRDIFVVRNRPPWAGDVCRFIICRPQELQKSQGNGSQQNRDYTEQEQLPARIRMNGPIRACLFVLPFAHLPINRIR